MATNTYINKVVYGGETLIDLTADTVTANKILNGYTAHDKSGAVITGTCPFDADTSDATAAVAEILSGKTAYVNATKLTGTMVNNGANNITVSTKAGSIIPIGFYDGSGRAAIDATSASNLIATNIRNGISVLGITGTLSAEDELTVGAVTATPYTTQQVITAANQDYDYITQVTIGAIAYSEIDNASGGKTVTIGSVAP